MTSVAGPAYPEITPYRTGFANVGHGHRVYWEECGNPSGKPVLILHGGPGAGCTPNNRRYYDPDFYRVVLFDQRNCGRSTPHASEPNVDLSTNTTSHLIADIEFLRNMLGVDRWIIQGASWGSVLALAYAETHPHRVKTLILLSLGTGRRLETDLLTVGLSPLFPEAWQQLAQFADEHTSEGPITERYNRLLFDKDPDVCAEAARRWCAWESAILPTAKTPSPRFESAEFRLAFARIVTHYWSNGSWLEEGAIIANASILAPIPGYILQGRLDLSNLSGAPWQLAAAWPGCQLEFVDEAGHEGSTSFSARLRALTDQLRLSS